MEADVPRAKKGRRHMVAYEHATWHTRMWVRMCVRVCACVRVSD